MVSTEGPAIIRLLFDGKETTEVCKLLRVCDGNEDLGDSLTSFRDNISIENLNPVIVNKKEDSTCATLPLFLPHSLCFLKDRPA